MGRPEGRKSEQQAPNPGNGPVVQLRRRPGMGNRPNASPPSSALGGTVNRNPRPSLFGALDGTASLTSAGLRNRRGNRVGKDVPPANARGHRGSLASISVIAR
jgi:hypothetical protein